MIQVDNLSLSFAGESLLDEVSFSLGQGEKLGLIGRNGSGKSTLFRLITGELKPDKGQIGQKRHYQIGALKQQIHFSKNTVLEEALLSISPDAQHLVEKILFGLGFSALDLTRSPHDLSGGFQLRLQLAKVLSVEPNCLLLDEPTNYLDIVSLRFLSRFLKRWKGEWILITHDREFMDQITTHTMAIHRKKIKKIKGPSSQLFEKILEDEELHEKTRQKTLKKEEAALDYIKRFGAKATKAKQAQSRKKMLAKLPSLEKLSNLYNLSFTFCEAPFPGAVLLDAHELCFHYDPKLPLIKDFSLQITKGDRIAIIGKNGKGKSTLLKLFAKEILPKSGEIDFKNNLQIGYFGQTHIAHLDPNLTIIEELTKDSPHLTLHEAKAIAGQMMFQGDLSEKRIQFLSGGEKSRVLLGKILAKQTNLLLLDEPTHHLDIESIEALCSALDTFSGSIVIVTHSESLLERLNLDKLIKCSESQEIFNGTYDDFLQKKGWSDEKKPPTPKKLSDHTERKAIKAQIRKCEKEIERLELECSDIERKIESAKTEELLELSTLLKQKQSAISTLFTSYETLFKELH
ncbi:MAG: ABC-F family ATP-binding cassette domain-containing protein [Simkaniaceae bacterium]